MARINLLPWREQLREERKRHFLMAMAGVVVGAIAIIFLADRFIGNAIDIQTARNAHLQSEIVLLDQRIKSISELKARRKQLLERMKTIQDLQGNRPIIGRIFDQMARTLPDGVYFTDVKMTDKNIAIAGAAETNNRVAGSPDPQRSQGQHQRRPQRRQQFPADRAPDRAGAGRWG